MKKIVIIILIVFFCATFTYASCSDDYENCCEICEKLYIKDVKENPDCPACTLVEIFKQWEKVNECIERSCIPKYEDCKRRNDENNNKKGGCFIWMIQMRL